MEALFKKYFWVIKTLGIAAATGLAASAITTQLGTNFLLDTDPAVTPDDAGEEDDEDEEEGKDGKKSKKPSLKFGSNPFGQLTAKKEAKQRTADKVMARNVFCPTCLPATPEGEAPTTSSGPMEQGRIAPGEIKSKLNMRLMATLEAEDPQYSFATIYDGDAGITGLYGRGDAVRADVVVEGVDQGLVHLRNHAQLEYLEIGTVVEAPKAATEKEEPKKKKKKKKNDRAIPGAEDAINCPNDNLCIVQRSFVDQVVSNPAMLAKQARVVPSQKDGKTQGYKLYGIRRGTLPKLLGLKNGDMITSINGEELTSIDKAMALYTKLRRASQLEVNITRKGKAMTKEIQIQ
ncbi:MAG: type II secretion system protein GspC [Myxococcota bacterium]